MRLDVVYFVLAPHALSQIDDVVIDCEIKNIHLFCDQIKAEPIAMFSSKIEAVMHAQQLLIDLKLIGLFPTIKDDQKSISTELLDSR